MQSTKSQILAALKRQGRCSVDELAVQLSLAQMTVRQHLATLERDDLVSSHEERQRLGRPHFVYALTEKGEESFPKRYDRIAHRLLLEVGQLNGDDLTGLTAEEKTALLFDKLADRFIDEHRAAMQSLTVPQRVAAVAQVLLVESGYAEWSSTDSGFVIRDFNCCYRKLGDGVSAANAADQPCRWHTRVLSELLDLPVQFDPDPSCTAHTCRFLILQRDAAAAGGDAGRADTIVLSRSRVASNSARESVAAT
ncbi:MAG: helix-turn-helix transcriptional regulator [Dehalococcoidia bacterium]